ncbi:MAG: glycosyltransferase [Bacteroidales bacterium]|nr:glycosyltransferase [Bacteroidales bacterium]
MASMSNPFFSIIIPTFNSSKYIKRCLDSIVGQSLVQWEALIMDGGSKDDTTIIAKSYNDQRISVYSEPDNGVYDAMNKGIDKATGNWLYFLGSDDYLLNNDILSQIIYHIPEKCDVFYGDVEAPQLDPRHKGVWHFEDIEFNRCHQAILYNRHLFSKLGYYNLKYIVYADHDMNLKWFLNKNIYSFYYPVTIAHYSDGGLSIQKKDNKFIDDFPILVLRYGWTSLNRYDKKKYINIIRNRIRFQIKWRKDEFFKSILKRKK